MNIINNLENDQSSFLKKNNYLNENLFFYDNSDKIYKSKKNIFLKYRINDLLNINSKIISSNNFKLRRNGQKNSITNALADAFNFK